MNVLSLFDGISAGRIALERAGVKVDNYFASEIDKNAIKVAQANYSDTVQLGSVVGIKAEQLPKIDLLTGGFCCFRKGTFIRTFDGNKLIEDIKAGDLVLTHENRYRKVLNLFKNKESKFKKVSIFGSLGLTVTDEHPIYTKLTKESPAEWVNVSDLKVGSYAAIQINFLSELPEYEGVTKVINQRATKLEKNINFESEDFWYFVGRWFGDGWTRVTKRKNRENSYQYKTIVCCGHNEFEELNTVISKLPYKYNFVKERTSYKFYIYDLELTLFLKRYGTRAYNKKLGNLLNLPKNLLEILIQGYISADGCSNGNHKNVSSVSKDLIYDIQNACLKVYRNLPPIHYHKTPDKYTIEGRIVNQRDYYILSIRENKLKEMKSFICDNICWVKIKEIADTDIVEESYNFEVEEDNSYIAENITVHNCQSFSFAGNQANFDDPRGKLFFECVRLLKECQPKYFLFENVKMKQEYQDVISAALGVSPKFIDSSLLSAQMRKRLYWTNIPFAEIQD